MPEDPLDLTKTLLLQHGVEPETARLVVSEVRRVFGGSTAYILSIDRSDRDAAARAALARGASIQEAARAAGCSPSTIRRRRSGWQ
jgi:hypothetical protein